MSDETTLLPCPFCGGEPEMHYTRPTEGIREGWLIWCHKCHAGGNWHTKEEDAIRIWNTRVTHGTLTAEQVRDVFLGNFEKAYETSYDLWEPSRFNWQAIADELNVCAERTCRNLDKHHNIMFKCSECGHWECQDFDGEKILPQTWNYCPNCGRRVVE